MISFLRAKVWMTNRYFLATVVVSYSLAFVALAFSAPSWVWWGIGPPVAFVTLVGLFATNNQEELRRIERSRRDLAEAMRRHSTG